MCTIKDKIFMIGGDSEQGLMEDPAMVYHLEIRKYFSPILNISLRLEMA